MKAWPRPWREIAFGLMVVGMLAWVAAVELFLVATNQGHPELMPWAIAIAVVGILLIFSPVAIAYALRRARMTRQVPADPQKVAAIRAAMRWVPLSYLGIFGGVAWMAWAIHQWPGPRGQSLGTGGLMAGLTLGTMAVWPFLRAARPNSFLVGRFRSVYLVLLLVSTAGSLVFGLTQAK